MANIIPIKEIENAFRVSIRCKWKFGRTIKVVETRAIDRWLMAVSGGLPLLLMRSPPLVRIVGQWVYFTTYAVQICSPNVTRCCNNLSTELT